MERYGGGSKPGRDAKQHAFERESTPVPVPKAADRLLIRAARRAPGWTAALVLAIAAGAAVSLLVPAALAAAVDAALRERHLATAVTRLAALLAAGAAADVVAGLAGASYEATTTAWLRHRLLGQGLALGIPGQRRFPPGDLISRLGADAPAAGQVLPDLLQAGAAVAASAGAVVALALID